MKKRLFATLATLEKLRNPMLKPKSNLKHIQASILLFLSLLTLVASFRGTEGSVNATHYPSDYNVLNGTYLSGSAPADVQAVDSDYFSVESAPSGVSTSAYNPSGYNLFGSTAYVSGTMEDLASDNTVHTVYRSYSSVTSAGTLYAHQEATTVGGNPYYIEKQENADSTGTTLTRSMGTSGRQLLGRFIYPLTGIGSIPSSTWTGFYRAWRDADPSISYDSTGSGNNGDGAANITWTHVVGSGNNRFMIIGISVRTVTVSVLNVTVGGQLATFLRSDVRDPSIRGEIWYLVNPSSGSKTVTVTLSAASKASGGSVSYTGVEQISPIDNHQSTSYGGDTPSVSLTTTVSGDWIFSNLAVSGTAAISAHGIGQVHRYYQVGTGGAGGSRAGNDGDDTPTTAAGSYTMSWNVSFWSDVIAQAVAFRPAPPPAGYVDVDISILKSDGATRATLATKVANSGDLTSTPTTLSGTYFWAAYSVVDQTDYLEIDYYIEVTTATSGIIAYLRIDDSALSTADQTRLANVMLPNEYTMEVELTGASNTYSWTQLTWTVDSAWTTDAITVTVQLYNYTLGSYPTSGNGFLSYTSNTTANTEETKTQTITTNPQHFRDAAGNWKIRVKGVKNTSAQFDFKADWVQFNPTYYSQYTVSTEFLYSSLTNASPVHLNFTVTSQYDIPGVEVTVQAWDYSSSTYSTSGQAFLKYTSIGTNETKTLSIETSPQSYASNGSARIMVTGVSDSPTQFKQEINQIRLVYSSLQPLDWLSALLYAVPVIFGLPFLLIFLLWRSQRKRKNGPHVTDRKDAFSKRFGMTHQELEGKKTLLEIDPTSDYHNVLLSFVAEAKNNNEPLFIVTNKDSALHSAFSTAGNIKFLLLTSKTSVPKQLNELETLLPAGDLSVLLDACVRIQRLETRKTINVLFDNLSDTILRCGFEKTYKFAGFLLESMTARKATIIFVFNPTAHSRLISSSIRGLFKNKLAYSTSGAKAGTL